MINLKSLFKKGKKQDKKDTPDKQKARIISLETLLKKRKEQKAQTQIQKQKPEPETQENGNWKYTLAFRKDIFKKIVEGVYQGDADELFSQYENSRLNLFEFLEGKGISYEEIARQIAKVFGKEFQPEIKESVITKPQSFLLLGQKSRKGYSFLPSSGADVIVPYDVFFSHYTEKKTTEKGEIQKYIYDLFARMMKVDMTDLMIEADRSLYLISYKELGGGRQEVEVMDKERGQLVVNAIKVMASKDSDVKPNIKDETQSGQIKVPELGLDIRVEFIPTILGENVSLRFFKIGGYFNQRITELGYSKRVVELVRKISTLKQGLVLVSGPTGHGKSTLIRSIILEADPSKKVVRAVEDPVESVIKGVTHVQVKEGQISFSDAIRSFMRANPDIIFVGEVRDPDTAVALIEASMTGHLTFSTTHSNTSIEAIQRVVSKAGEKGTHSRDELLSSMASSLVASFAQRLVKLSEKGQKETGRKVLPVVEIFAPDKDDRKLIENGDFLKLIEKLNDEKKTLYHILKNLHDRGWIDDETFYSLSPTIQQEVK